MERRQVKTVDGTLITFRCGSQRSGSPVVLLHGWGCDSTVFNSLLPLAGLDIVAVDLPGFGASAEPAAVYDHNDYAAAVCAVMDSLAIGSFSLFAHSFGCRPALALAASGRVERLLLTGAAGLPAKRSIFKRLRIAVYKVGKLLPAVIASRLGQKLGSPDWQASSPRMRAVMARNLAINLEPLLADISCPVFLLWGNADTATPLWMMECFAGKLRDCGTYVLPGGHFVFIEQPQITRAIMTSFFRGKGE